MGKWVNHFKSEWLGKLHPYHKLMLSLQLRTYYPPFDWQAQRTITPISSRLSFSFIFNNSLSHFCCHSSVLSFPSYLSFSNTLFVRPLQEHQYSSITLLGRAPKILWSTSTYTYSFDTATLFWGIPKSTNIKGGGGGRWQFILSKLKGHKETSFRMESGGQEGELSCPTTLVHWKPNRKRGTLQVSTPLTATLLFQQEEQQPSQGETVTTQPMKAAILLLA